MINFNNGNALNVSGFWLTTNLNDRVDFWSQHCGNLTKQKPRPTPKLSDYQEAPQVRHKTQGKEVEKNKLGFSQDSIEVKRIKKEITTALEIVINAWNRTKNIIFPSENVITQPYYCLASRRVFLIGNVSLITNKKKNYIISIFHRNFNILYAAPLWI